MSLSKQHRQESVNKVCGRQRVYDHLYDPVHAVSSEADHARCNFRAHASVDRLRRVPRFGCMFSSLPHHPPCTLRLSAVDPVPPTIDRRWRGPHTDAQRSRTLQQLAGVLPGSGSEFREQECDVNAADRWKFFNRPHILYTHHLPPDVVFAPLVLSGSLHEPGGVEDKKPAGVYHRTVAVQTDYRDGEAQTDPYSPEYVAHGLPCPPVLATWRSTVEQRAVDMMHHIFDPSKRENLQLCVGPLLHMLMENMEEKLQGTAAEPNRKLFLYSAHDTTLIPCLMAMGIFDMRWPPYAADITLELHQHKQTGEAFVKVSYIGQDQLIAGCSGVYCPVQEFKQALSACSLSFELYQSRCSNTEGVAKP